MPSPALIFLLCLDHGHPSDFWLPPTSWVYQPLTVLLLSLWGQNNLGMLGMVWPLISFCSSDLSSLMWHPQLQAQLLCRTRHKWPREAFSLGWIQCRVMLRSGWEAPWCMVRDLSWEPANPAKPLCSGPLPNLGWNPSFSRESHLSFQPRTAAGWCQTVPVLRSLFYIVTSWTQVPDPLSPVIFSWLWVLKAWPLIHDSLLDGSMELSASSSHPVLTSLGLVTRVLHLGSC